MLTLGIETSCDETSCAVLRGRDKILSNVISSSLFRHKPFGGIVPEIASRHALEQISVVFQEALREARVKSSAVDLVAVTRGPGLIGSLLVGVGFAKSLAYSLGVPLIGVNHLDAHLVANFIGAEAPSRYLGLLVSGGHTSLSQHERGAVKLLGQTVDDAAGEAYDKVAKILGLGFPGGPVLDRLSREGNPKAFRFTKPKQDNRFDFSFSGIKTAVLYEVRKQTGKKDLFVSGPAELPETFVRDMAASFQHTVVDWLVEKVLDAAAFKKIRDVVVGGGVSANSGLRETLHEKGRMLGYGIWFPERVLSLDNAAMIARRGIDLYEKFSRKRRALKFLKLSATANLEMGA